MSHYATLLRDQVTLKIRSIDRIFLQAYVPRLQTVGLVCQCLRWQRNFPIPSSAAFGRIGDQYLKAIDHFAEQPKIPRVEFEKGQTKRKWRFPTCKPLPRKVGIESPGSERHKRRRRLGGLGPGKDRRKRLIPTWIEGDRWPTSSTSISIFGMQNGEERFGRPTPMPRFRFGFGLTGMNGPSGS